MPTAGIDVQPLTNDLGSLVDASTIVGIPFIIDSIDVMDGWDSALVSFTLVSQYDKCKTISPMQGYSEHMTSTRKIVRFIPWMLFALHLRLLATDYE